MTNWKRTVGQKIRNMTAEQAKELLAKKQDVAIGSDLIRDLTGGFSSQAIDMYVLRKLGIKAGYIKDMQ